MPVLLDLPFMEREWRSELFNVFARSKNLELHSGLKMVVSRVDEGCRYLPPK